MDHGIQTFGADGAYYAITGNELERKLAQPQTASMKEFGKWLEKDQKELPKRVERAFKQWNLKIRDQLRVETGLRLSLDHVQQSVPVQVADGFPEPLEFLMKELGQDLFRWQLKKPMLLATAKTLEDIEKKKQFLDSDIIPRSTVATPAADKQQIDATSKYVGQIIAALEKEDLNKRLSDINTDCLGAYFFKASKILLYWMAIGFFSRKLNVSPEALTVVTATHELAHAYTHMGFDIDGKRWETDHFAASDLHIVEGLAQYYTHLVCKKLETRYPEALEAYEAFLQMQSGPYLTQLKWERPRMEAGEVVRATMIECRNLGCIPYCEFTNRMDTHWEQIKQVKR